MAFSIPVHDINLNLAKKLTALVVPYFIVFTSLDIYRADVIKTNLNCAFQNGILRVLLLTLIVWVFRVIVWYGSFL